MSPVPAKAEILELGAMSAQRELLQRAQQGDPEAFESLLHPHLQKMYNLALRLLSNEDDAQECCQEALVRAWRKLPSFRGSASFATWLRRIVTNTCLDRLRQRKRENVVSLDHALVAEDGDDWVPELPDTQNPLPDEAVFHQERNAAIRAAIARLPDEYRVALVLCELEHYSYVEAARLLGIPMGTLKSRINRARQLLRRLLVPYLSPTHTQTP